MYFAPYISVAKRKAKAEKKIKQLRKKNPGILPINIEGKLLAKTWWGKSWNQNLERYSDYRNRLERGRSYVRHNSVLDLQIEPGKVSSLVMGSGSTPYKVMVKIDKIGNLQWGRIRKQCEGKLKSLTDLLQGKISKSLSDILLAQNKGLFPSPAEIHFSCSCPDGAYMCKHVAAVLYGVGARLDNDPTMFFTLRQVIVDDLLEQAIEGRTKSLLAKSKEQSSRILQESELSNVFGIEFDEKIDPVSNKKKSVPNKTSQLKMVKKGRSTKAKKTSQADIVEQLIRGSQQGIRTAEIRDKSGIPVTDIYKIVAKLKRQQKIQAKFHGVYIATPGVVVDKKTIR